MKVVEADALGKAAGNRAEEVVALLEQAEVFDNKSLDGMDLPAELERRETRLQQLAAAKARIEERARVRDTEEQAEYEAKCAKQCMADQDE